MLILTAAGDLHDRVRGLDTGADDYLTKPFELEELVAACARSCGVASARRARRLWRLGRLSFDTARRRFALGELPLALAPREHGMLELLLAHAGRPISKDRLCDRLARDDEVPSASALEICAYRLRRSSMAAGFRSERCAAWATCCRKAKPDATLRSATMRLRDHLLAWLLVPLLTL